jgi:putative oxidoreductase
MSSNSNVAKGSVSNSLLEALPLIGRVLLAAIFLLSGISKLSNPAGTVAYIASVGLPFPELGLVIATIVEIFGGIALILGYKPRIVAMTLALYTLATAVFFHHNFGDKNQFLHFFKNLAMSGGLLQIVAFGAGRLSLDYRFKRTL